MVADEWSNHGVDDNVVRIRGKEGKFTMSNYKIDEAQSSSLCKLTVWSNPR